MRKMVLEQRMVRAEEHEIPAIKQVEALLNGQGTPSGRQARLVGADNAEVELPGPIQELLRQAMPLLLRGDAITFVPYHQELTTQEAADLLNMSRQYLVTLLDRGELPCSMTGTHRRLALADVLACKERRRTERRTALARLTALAEEAGEYD